VSKSKQRASTNSKPKTANPKQQTQNSKHKTANPKQQTQNSKPKTANPKQQTEQRKNQMTFLTFFIGSQYYGKRSKDEPVAGCNRDRLNSKQHIANYRW
jgi:hypothetical protein